MVADLKVNTNCLPNVYTENKKPLQSIDLQGFILNKCDPEGIRTPIIRAEI